MSNIIHLPISASARILVAAGDKINPKTALARYHSSFSYDKLHVAKLLNVKNHKILKFLKKKLQDKIKAGDIIAEKKGMFSTVKVKSPFDGTIGEADLTNGSLSILQDTKTRQQDFFSLVSGTVSEIGKSFLTIETDCPIFKSEKSEGSDASGILRFLEKEKVGILDYFDDLENSIVLCRSIDEAVTVKFQVIGVRGIITLGPKREIGMPWMSVSENTLDKLVKFDGKKIWIRPFEKEIIIIDE